MVEGGFVNVSYITTTVIFKLRFHKLSQPIMDYRVVQDINYWVKLNAFGNGYVIRGLGGTYFQLSYWSQDDTYKGVVDGENVVVKLTNSGFKRLL